MERRSPFRSEIIGLALFVGLTVVVLGIQSAVTRVAAIAGY